MKLIGLSLFANVGIAETYLESLGVEIAVANELIEKRCELYSHFYPETIMIRGDIGDPKIKSSIVKCSKENKVNFIIATPPCQGMSTVGKMDKNDFRNILIKHAIDVILELRPKYILIENVPQQLRTEIVFKNKLLKIPEYIKKSLEKYYNFNQNTIINAKNYGVPQDRERSIFLLSRKDQEYIWEFPKKYESILTVFDAIGDLPHLDPLIYDIPYKKHLEVFPEYEKKLNKALEISRFFIPPKHVYRQVVAMTYTPSGKSAFENKKEYQPMKINGVVIRAFKNTYKRMSWNKPANTITTYNRTIGSQDNVHPGRPLKTDKSGDMMYSDPRVLTLYELIILSSLPKNWNLPEKFPESFVRTVIGEGIPPLLIKNIVSNLSNHIKKT